MPAELSRRFTLFDAATLIAATAIGFALTKPASIAYRSRPITVTGSPADLMIAAGLLYATPLVFSYSLAVVGLGLRRPRATLRRLGRWPGFVANAAGALGALLCLVQSLGLVLVAGSPYPTAVHLALLFFNGLPSVVGAFVVGALLSSLLGRRVRPRAVWTDRFAWGLGLAWVAMLLASWSRQWVVRL